MVVRPWFYERMATNFRRQHVLVSRESANQLPPILVSRRDAGRLLNLCLRTVSLLIARGELRVKRVGKRVLILREDLEKFAREPGRFQS